VAFAIPAGASLGSIDVPDADVACTGVALP